MSPVTIRNISKALGYFHALSDETRLGLLEKLKEGERCVCDLTDLFKTGQSRLSFHLKVLKEAGLISARPDGRWVYYSLNTEALDDLKEIVTGLKSPVYRSSKKDWCP